MSRYLSERLRSLEPYVPGEQPQDRVYVKLNTNESPFAPDERVVEAVRKEAERLQLYPDPTCRKLKQALAARYGVKETQVLVTNGSDEALNFAIFSYCDDDRPVVYPDISYGFYSVFADLYNLERTVVPLKADFTMDVEAICKARGMVVIANPTAPTGIALGLDAIETILKSDPDRIVLIDEAYVDFGAQSCVPLIRDYENLIVVQTFSKSRSMAGARLGFLIANEALIRDLEAVRNSTNPYNINRMTMAAGIAALECDKIAQERCGRIIQIREEVKTALEDLGCEVLPSSTNFLFAKPPVGTGKEWYLGIKEKGVLVRYLKGERTGAFVRITIGSRDQMDRFLEATRAYFEEAEHEKK